MTAHIAKRLKAASFAAVVVAIGLVHFAPSLALAPTPVADIGNAQENDQDFEQVSVGRNACCFMMPDDWIYWDR